MSTVIVSRCSKYCKTVITSFQNDRMLFEENLRFHHMISKFRTRNFLSYAIIAMSTRAQLYVSSVNKIWFCAEVNEI